MSVLKIGVFVAACAVVGVVTSRFGTCQDGGARENKRSRKSGPMIRRCPTGRNTWVRRPADQDTGRRADRHATWPSSDARRA